MRTSPPGTDQRGLTLIELLVVLAIMGVMAGLVVLSVPPRAGPAERAADAFAASLPRYPDAALAQGATMGLALREGAEPALILSRYDGERWRDQASLPLPEGVEATLAPQGELLPADPEPRGTLIVYRPAGEKEEDRAPAPPILMGPTGEVTPFALTLTDGEEDWVVALDASGRAGVSRAR